MRCAAGTSISSDLATQKRKGDVRVYGATSSTADATLHWKQDMSGGRSAGRTHAVEKKSIYIFIYFLSFFFPFSLKFD